MGNLLSLHPQPEWTARFLKNHNGFDPCFLFNVRSKGLADLTRYQDKLQIYFMQGSAQTGWHICYLMGEGEGNISSNALVKESGGFDPLWR